MLHHTWLDNPRWIWLFAFRLLNLALVKTWFVPDEYFQVSQQSVEVAYHKVFGVGHLTWEWRPEIALRSHLHPLIFMAVFAPARWLGVDASALIRWAPAVLHCAIFALADVYMAELMARLFVKAKKEVPRSAFLLYLSNWFVWYCAPRTLANSLECALTLIGLHWYPVERARAAPRRYTRYEFVGYSIAASLACLVRPTAALIWAPLALVHLVRAKHTCTSLLVRILVPAAVVLALTVAVDSALYGRVTVAAFNFVRFNMAPSGSARFGVNTWYYYLVEGLPPLLSVCLVPFVLAVREAFGAPFNGTSPKSRQLASSDLLLHVALFYIGAHSFIPHKEHRFMLPVIPLVMPYIASLMCRMHRLSAVMLWSTVLLQVPIALFIGIAHQAAPISAAAYLRHQLDAHAANATAAGGNASHTPLVISQLMPCYSMPQYAALHPHGVQNTQVRALDCSPQFNKTMPMAADGPTESDRFASAPLDFLRENWPRFANSTYIVAFERTQQKLDAFLHARGYAVVRKLYDTPYPVSSNRDEWMFVLKRVDA